MESEEPIDDSSFLAIGEAQERVIVDIWYDEISHREYEYEDIAREKILYAFVHRENIVLVYLHSNMKDRKNQQYFAFLPSLSILNSWKKHTQK